MSAPEVRREEGQVTRFCSLFLILDSGSNVSVRAMSKDVRLLPVFASAISIQFFYCMMSAGHMTVYNLELAAVALARILCADVHSQNGSAILVQACVFTEI